MNYNNHQSIFIQIADRICDRILNGDYQADGRIPSVRELGVEMEVNPNTVVRSFERLQVHEIIYNKRGLGYFVSPQAEQQIRHMRHSQFMDETLPDIFREMQLLGITLDDVAIAYNTHLSR